MTTPDAPVLNAGTVIAALRAVRDGGRPALLALTARAMRAAGGPYTSVYLYMLHGNELVLETYDGRETEHTRIPVGRGVCGTAVSERRDQNVPDVTASVNYLACNLHTRSELVVLIEKDGGIIGQIDVDSDVPAGFGAEEHRAVRRIADELGQML